MIQLQVVITKWVALRDETSMSEWIDP